jgi:hypothetical protein
VRIAYAFGNCADMNVAEIINVRAFLSVVCGSAAGEFGHGHHSSRPGPALSLSGILNVDWQDFGARGKLALKGYPSQDGQEAGCHAPSKRTPQREENQPIGWAWNMGELLLIGPNLVRASRNVRTIAGRGDVVVPLVGSSERLPIGFLINAAADMVCS